MENKNITYPLDDTKAIDQSLLNACIHCGLCLPACPTYLSTGRESESPRGRIYLLDQWQQSEQPFSARMAEHLDSCLGCLGCQTACPSGVNYEAIFNQAKVQVNAIAPYWQKLPRYIVFRWLLPNDLLLEFFGKALRLWQLCKFDLAFKAALSPFKQMALIKEILRWQSLLPTVPKHLTLPKAYSSSGDRAEIVQLFKGCVMDILYNEVNIQSLQLLALSFKSVVVSKQTCCGALACHAGERELAKKLAIENIDNYSSTNGPIIGTASGCTAMLKSYPELFNEQDPWHARAVQFSARVQDLPQALAKQQFKTCHQIAIKQFDKPMTIAYHAACHLAHAQGVRQEPKQILENFAQAVNDASGCQKINIVSLIEEEYCCGSAGIYNLGHPNLSEQILARKIDKIELSGADVIVTTNPGCILQMQAGLEQRGLNIPVYHIATLLAKAYLNSF